MYWSLSRNLWSKCYLWRHKSRSNVFLSPRNEGKCICSVWSLQRFVLFPPASLPNLDRFLIHSSAPVETNPCQPSPCGPNSQCRERNGQAICSCVPGFVGSPPTCRPECITSNECPQNEACNNQKCVDPCPGTCGINAKCQVLSHNPICSCPPRYTGDPFIRCQIEIIQDTIPTDPCQPSPCGSNAQCRVTGDQASCSCLPGMIGNPPYCKPECISNSECSSHLACINKKCQDPCPNACGQNAQCKVVSHTPMCYCLSGFTGDPFGYCTEIREDYPVEVKRPCSPSPCGSNAICREQNGAGTCSCVEDYVGNPYEGCRPECVLNSDCPSNLACINSRCKDPCPGTCGQNAMCQVVNHLPSCTCLPGYTGDPFRYCNFQQEERKISLTYENTFHFTNIIISYCIIITILTSWTLHSNHINYFIQRSLPHMSTLVNHLPADPILNAVK